MQYLHHDGGNYKRHAQYDQDVFVEESLYIGIHEGEVLQALEQHEVKYGCDGYTTENANFEAQVLGYAEAEYDTRDILNERTEHKGYWHTQEYTQYHLKCF